MPVQVTVVDHPLIAAALTRIRDESTPNTLFRQELERIGTLLLAEGFQQHISKGYIYFAMCFSVAVEVINIRVRTQSP